MTISLRASIHRGSSPRVRGKLVGGVPAHPQCGLIPACAGKTTPAPAPPPPRSAHPRVCGENIWAPRSANHREGSSPRVRGKHDHPRGQRDRYRLIPACAGKTRRLASRSRRWGAHPRVCGENVDGVRGESRVDGSSPRVRGKPGRACPPGAGPGLIPACAGKTGRGAGPWGDGAAHPRVCGENFTRKEWGEMLMGSSPRVRGKQRRLHGNPVLPGLIPACAGKTGSTRPWGAPAAAHPRVCGENESITRRIDALMGSSPRVRGKHFLTWAFTAQAGQILETLGPSAFSGSYSFPGARANGGQCRARRRGLCTGPALGRPLGAS